MKVTIIGAGMVGYATGIGLSRLGNKVTFFDTDPKVVSKLRHNGHKTAPTLAEGILESSIVMLCLPTPLSGGTLDMSCMEATAEELGPIVDTKIVVSRSTVVPGSTRKLSRYLPPEGLVYNPEFLRHKFALEDFLKPHRIIIGSRFSRARKKVKELYKNIKAPIICTDWETAEAAKLLSNGFLATKISFFNELWFLCEKLGVHTRQVERVLALDKRIGSYGIKGGTAFDGPCLPKDSRALVTLGKDLGLRMGILDAVLRLNREIESTERGTHHFEDHNAHSGKNPSTSMTPIPQAHLS